MLSSMRDNFNIMLSNDEKRESLIKSFDLQTTNSYIDFVTQEINDLESLYEKIDEKNISTPSVSLRITDRDFLNLYNIGISEGNTNYSEWATATRETLVLLKNSMDNILNLLNNRIIDLQTKQMLTRLLTQLSLMQKQYNDLKIKYDQLENKLQKQDTIIQGLQEEKLKEVASRSTDTPPRRSSPVKLF